MPGDGTWYAERLAHPSRRAARPQLVIDTDAANEIDDQFALAWALLSPLQLDVRAICAAPFSFAHRRAALGHRLRDERPFNAPGVGMERSFDEILRVLDALALAAPPPVLRGAAGYLRDASTPRTSDAARQIVELALRAAPDAPLYVLALGCATNVASALLLEPAVLERIVVVWTSGYPSHARHVNDSFNLEQDLAASQLLLDSGVPLVYLPGFHVGAQLRLTLPEVERHVQGCGAIGALLADRFLHNPLWELHGVTDLLAHSWVMWDLICVAWMLDDAWVPSALVRTPRLDDRRRWQRDDARPPMREAHAVRRDAIFRDLFEKLAAAASR